MEEGIGITVGSRRNEDIALDLMKFVAVTTGYGKTGSPGAGFQGSTDSKAPSLPSGCSTVLQVFP
jgi:hypothetical protein